MQSSLNSLVVWVPYHDVDESSLPVEVIPGSHKRGLLPAVKIKHEYGVDPEHYNAEDFTPIHINKGDALVFSSFLVHRTATKPFGDIRIASSFRYDDAANPSYVERGYPNPFKKALDRELIERHGFYPTL